MKSIISLIRGAGRPFHQLKEKDTIAISTCLKREKSTFFCPLLDAKERISQILILSGDLVLIISLLGAFFPWFLRLYPSSSIPDILIIFQNVLMNSLSHWPIFKPPT